MRGDRSGGNDDAYTWSNWAIFSCWAGSGAAIANEAATVMTAITAVNMAWIMD